MRGTTTCLLAMTLFLGLCEQSSLAQSGSSRRQPPTAASACLADDSSGGDLDSTAPAAPAATVRVVRTSRSSAATQASYAQASDSAEREVAPGLADKLSDPSEPAPENVATPTKDAMLNGPMLDGATIDGPMCCPPAGCCRCPCWTVSVGAIFLNQSGPGHSPVVSQGIFREPRFIPGPTLVGANQFDPGIRFGYELDAIRHNLGGSCWDLEARYFGINRWTATAPTVTVVGAAVIPFVPTPIPIANTGSTITTVYQSLLQNAEFNARRNINPWLQLIVGLRYIAFDDSVGITVTPTVGASRFSTINTRNNLIGPQLGANAFLWQGSRAAVQAFGKGGIFGNIDSNNVSATAINNAAFGSSANGSHTSFVGEVGLTGTYRITNNWGLRSTYEMLWLDGVARAPDQIASSNPAIGAGSVTSNGALFYYGAFFGLEYYR
ncbi:MAG TPA: hypothetical protein VHY20_01910 [Pirellulales bacterium]|nr:hypothetical protein [Pirellulales bacterium]